MHSAFEKPRENRGKAFSIGINLFLGQQTRQHLNHWLCGGSVVFCACVFFFLLLDCPLFSVLEAVSLSRAITLLTQEANSKQVVVLFNQNFHLQLVLSWVIEVCFIQFRSWCLIVFLFGSGRHMEFGNPSFPSLFILVLMLIKSVRCTSFFLCSLLQQSRDWEARVQRASLSVPSHSEYYHPSWQPHWTASQR